MIRLILNKLPLDAFAASVKYFSDRERPSSCMKSIISSAKRLAPFRPSLLITSVKSRGGIKSSSFMFRSMILSGGRASRIPSAMPRPPSSTIASGMIKLILCFKLQSTTQFFIAVSFPAPCPPMNVYPL
ncbi:unnamed protein product [Bacillus phage SPP1]|uniref:Bacteriophage SPP1 complete nucleotide sequence n=1 Tax=Bacillus phage SPP1 TaxID=10724 RepID=O48486_BPSPP|nr:hypothetical protein SPP1p066 [Bacillus phage SPP1]CAA66533.1 unnamed protein product [Bacillus phage SPP1]